MRINSGPLTKRLGKLNAGGRPQGPTAMKVPGMTANVPTALGGGGINNNSGTASNPVQYTPGGVTLPPAPDPRDPTYWTDIGKIEQYYKNTNAALDEDLTRGQTGLKNSLANLDYQQPRDIQRQREAYNTQGLFYSTALGRAEGDMTTSYTNARTNANTAYGDLVTRINRSRTDLEDQYGPNGTLRASALSGATGRQTEADANAANNSALASLTAALTGGIDRTVPQYNAASGQTPKQFLGGLGGKLVNRGGKWYLNGTRVG